MGWSVGRSNPRVGAWDAPTQWVGAWDAPTQGLERGTLQPNGLERGALQPSDVGARDSPTVDVVALDAPIIVSHKARASLRASLCFLFSVRCVCAMAASASAEIVVHQSESSEYSFENGVLKLRGDAVKVYYFSDDAAMPWFHAKAIHGFIGAATIRHTMARVHDENKSSLKELVEKKGSPIAAGSSCAPALTLENLGYHDGKSYYVNEPGLYQIMFGSVKPAAKAFTNWVIGVVLPALRKSGTYSVKRPSGSGGGVETDEADSSHQLAFA